MGQESVETIQAIMLGVVTLICTGAIPWAFIVERRMARIETRISNGMSQRLTELETDVRDIGATCHKLEKELIRIHATMSLPRPPDPNSNLPGDPK